MCLFARASQVESHLGEVKTFLQSITLKWVFT